MRPLASDRASAAMGFGIAENESIVAGIGACDMPYAAADVPWIGTLNFGCPRGGVVVSVSLCDTGSHGSMAGCFLKSVNHVHAPNATGNTATAIARPARTT